MKINITNTLCSSPLLCCCFTAGLKNSLNLLIEINKQPSSEHTNFPGFFTKSESKQQVCYLTTTSTSFDNNAYETSLNSEAKSILFAVNNLRRDSTPRFTRISSVNEAKP